MRVIVVGYGVQGRKRARVAGADLVATVDPHIADADRRSVSEIPADSYDAALLCTPDEVKIELIETLVGQGKHVLVEKPLVANDEQALRRIAELARTRRAICYTAYNHRFEPHFVRMRDVIASGELGRLYHLRLFYGNGTARLVRDSAWRDKGGGVVHDLGSHLLDTARFWFPALAGTPALTASNCFENRAPDHAIFSLAGTPSIEAEMTLLSWRNHFTADLYAEKGSAHISSLCKWGPSTFTLRRRVLPSGRPPEDSVTLAQDDPTWEAEYRHFKALCAAAQSAETSPLDLATDLWINGALRALDRQRHGKGA